MYSRPEAQNSGSDLPLVLLPGTLCDARVFAPLLERMPARNTQVLLTPEADTLEQAADQVLGQAPPGFALLGFSLGGMVAMQAALRAPDRIRGLALLSTTPLAVAPSLHAARRAAVDHAQGMPMARFLREHLWPDYSSPASTAEHLLLAEEMAEALGPVAFARQTEQALRRSDVRPHLAALTCPTLILAGERDTLCPPAAQRQLAEAMPHATSILLPEAGHFALLEQPDKIASAVAAWFHTASAQLKAEPVAHHANTHQPSGENE